VPPGFFGTHLTNVGIGLVGVGGVGPSSGGGEITAVCAQIGRRAEGGVVGIEQVRSSVPVPVPVPPCKLSGGGNELHGPDGVIPAGTAIQGTRVRVGDSGESGPIEARAHNGPLACPAALRPPPPNVPYADSTKPTAATVFSRSRTPERHRWPSLQQQRRHGARGQGQVKESTKPGAVPILERPPRRRPMGAS
jgi:hypothetical protein